MSALTGLLKEECLKREREGISDDRYRLGYHLMPPVGWLNDPNGLCQYRGVYHVFFQYSPFDADGGLKLWGHYTSRDLVHWEYEGAPLYPDSPWDCHGVYSGSAYTDADGIHLFYTGNVKLDGDYDYVTDGRESNTVYVNSPDGAHFESKELLMGSGDYPDSYTRHIRDPKVFRRNGRYFMVLGGRKKGDKGAALLYAGSDLHRWSFAGELTTKETFGYMWECPDCFTLDGQDILSVSPQGLKEEEYRFQNIYQSGYFPVKGGLPGELDADSFEEWDYGFDFYAPQTFQDESGRRILIGWMGVPDAPYRNPTVSQGWQHALTVPRKLWMEDGRVMQYPVKELESLRQEAQHPAGGVWSGSGRFDMEIGEIRPEEWELAFDGRFSLQYRRGILTLRMDQAAGAGRGVRRARTGAVRSLRILMDTSAAEIYVNGGAYVFTTRVYPQNPRECTARWDAAQMPATVYEMITAK